MIRRLHRTNDVTAWYPNGLFSENAFSTCYFMLFDSYSRWLGNPRVLHIYSLGVLNVGGCLSNAHQSDIVNPV